MAHRTVDFFFTLDFKQLIPEKNYSIYIYDGVSKTWLSSSPSRYKNRKGSSYLGRYVG